jgi:hypothetical protein
MGFTESASAPTEPAQMPQATSPGPAPTPYSAGSQRPEPPDYSPMPVSFSTPGVIVLAPAEGGPLQESAYAHDINAGLVVDYVPGVPQPVAFPGNADAGGRDDVSGSVAGAVANAEGRYLEHEGDTHGIGSTIGDLMAMPPGPIDPGAAPGEAAPSGAYFDPPRSY